MHHVCTVVRQTMLAASCEESWRHLVDGALISKWFADSDDLRPGGSFKFAFGDGDFFSGVVTEWDPPFSLGLEWRFLDVGPRFDIRFSLLPVGDKTELSVQDRGAASVEEALGLREGWDDFLMRCERIVRTGENCRYRWTELFGGTAFVTETPALWSRLAGAELWSEFFPGSEVDVRRGNDRNLCLEFRDPRWGELRTEGQLRTAERNGQTCLNMKHSGWDHLPADIQVGERARYAGKWTRLLKQIESAYLQGS